MADFDTAEFRASRFSRSRADDIADRTFPVAMRGYDRAAVDAFLQEVVQIITDLESRQSQESVVQRAIAEVGEETAGILQRAHETAEEIAARTVNKERARSGEAEQKSKTSTGDISSGRRGGLRSHKGSGGRTKAQLYEEAKKKNIEGRSKMSKAELENAVGR